MLNLTTVLSGLLSGNKKNRKLSKVRGKIGKDLWLVEDSITSNTQNIRTSNLEIGDYIIHEESVFITNLGTVDLRVVNV